MSSLMLRGLDADLVARVRAYARDHDLPLPEAAAILLDGGLRVALRAVTAAQASADALSPAQRSARARRAATARWSTR